MFRVQKPLNKNNYGNDDDRPNIKRAARHTAPKFDPKKVKDAFESGVLDDVDEDGDYYR